MNRYKTIQWHIIYRQIALQLHKYYKQNKSASGLILFELLNGSIKYKKHNSWLSNIKRIKRPSLDPIQLFVSVSRSRQNERVRTEIINEVCSLLGIHKNWEQINFEGCPTPVALKLQYIRPETVQIHIWEAFNAVMQNGKKALTPFLWEEVKEWRGIQIPSFTIFLFWINSDNFLPLDKNTRQYLEQGGLLKPNSGTIYQIYISLLNNRRIRNYTKLSLEAYYFVNEPKSFKKKFKRNSLFQSDYISSSTFKFVGIRTLTRNSEIHKILNSNQYYPFDFTLIPDYSTNGKGKQLTRFKFVNNEIETLYSLESLKINITAIVGKNGSGKSTLLDLLLMGIYNLSIELGFIDSEENSTIKRLNIEIYWHTDTLYKLVFGREITFFRFRKTVDELKNIIYELPNESSNLLDVRDNFFYSILVNYSHYALNSTDYKIDWITPLSHKNDGYITPLVINPKRTDGNIDINTQKHLLNMRLLLNMIELHDDDIPLQSFRYIDNGKYLKYFSLSYDEQKQKEKEKEANKHIYEDSKIIRIIMDKANEVFGLPGRTKIPTVYISAIEYYLSNKLFTIISRYERFKNEYEEGLHNLVKHNIASTVEGMDWEYEIALKDRLQELLQDIQKDKSHITLKFKQAINYLKYPSLNKLVNESVELKKLIEFDKYKQVVEKIINDNPNDNFTLAEFLPPPIFKLEFYLDDINKSSFNKASSGEYQLLSVLSSILYHIRNIDSIDTDNRYNYIAAVLDEIELYFHPNLQRLFVKKLLDALSKLETDLYGIHIIFATHSPFILSDLQQRKILKLKNGGVEKAIDSYNTFAANIHDLLADEFFLNEGYLGAFAQRQIEKAITILNYIIADNEIKGISNYATSLKERNALKTRWESEKTICKDRLQMLGYWTETESLEIQNIENVKSSLFALIDSIGEPLIKDKLQKMYSLAFEIDYRNETDNRNKAKQSIIQLMAENNITLEELN